MSEELNTRTGEISEAEYDLHKTVARKMGWVDKDEWHGKEENWTPADQFLENTPEEIQKLKETKRRISQVAEATIAREREETRKQAEADLRKAIADGDENRAVQASQKYAQSVQPDQRILAWKQRNPWFDTDLDMQGLAITVHNRVSKTDADLDEQLEQVEREVRKRFPEYFGIQESPTKTKTLASVQAPIVQGGTPSYSGKKERWEDIPADERKEMEYFVLTMSRNGKLSRKDAEAEIASSYFEDKRSRKYGR